MKKLTFRKQLILGVIIICIGFICSEIFKQSIFSNIAWTIYGALFLIHPVYPQGAYIGRHGMLYIRLVGLLIMVIGISAQFGV